MNVECVTLYVVPSFSGSWAVQLSEKDFGASYEVTIERPKLDVPFDLRHQTPEDKQKLIVSRTVELERHEAQDFLNRCQQVAIVAVPAMVIGCDGTMYHLQIECGFNRVEFSWWCDLPREWMALDTIVRTLEKWRRKFEAV